MNLNAFSRFLEVRYSPIPTPVKSNSQKRCFLSLPKRYFRFFLVFLAACILVIFVLFDTRQVSENYEIHGNASISIQYPDIPYPEIQLTSPDRSNLPPLYERYRTYEDRVSEWNLKTYGNSNDRYMYISNHATGAGWGNIMQEMVYSTLLASGSGRGVVWDEYTWNGDGSSYSQFNGKPIPSKIPLSVMMAGYFLGLPKSPGLPPSISKRIYDRICPHDDRLYLDDSKVKEYIGLPKDSDDLYWRSSGKELLDAWLSLLNSPDVRDKRCVQITGPQIFTIWVLHTPRLHSLVKALFSSPVLMNWGWSELVKGVFRKNLRLFLSASTMLRLTSSRMGLSTRWLPPQYKAKTSVLNSILESDTSPLPLLVLHLRRGDYEGHCQGLAKWHSTYVGMVTLPEFDENDPFVLPNTTYDEHFVPEDVARFYIKHCYPGTPQIKQRVREVLHDYEKVLDAEDRKKPGRIWRMFGRVRWYGLKPLTREKVKKVYIMSNGNRAWLSEVKKQLKKDAMRSAYNSQWEFAWSWEDIGNSRDLVAGWEEKPVLQHLDMYVGQRAELFVGNGFSTLTSNLVMLRKHNGFHPIQTRFW